MNAAQTKLADDALVGITIHFLESISVPVRGGMAAEARIMSRGDELELTAEVIAAGKDRNGASWLDRLGDDAAQVARWGHVAFQAGPWPKDQPTWRRGDAQWAEAREQARKEAWAEVDPRDREEALRAVQRLFGHASTSRTLNVISERR